MGIKHDRRPWPGVIVVGAFRPLSPHAPDFKVRPSPGGRGGLARRPHVRRRTVSGWLLPTR